MKVTLNKNGKAEWQIKPLGELCDVVGGGTPPKDNPAYYSGDIPWATVRDMQSDVIQGTEYKITAAAVQASATNVIPANNVVIATRVGLGKVCMIKQPTAINQDLRGVIPKKQDEIDVRYLFWWFKSVAHVIQNEGTGATVKGISLHTSFFSFLINDLWRIFSPVVQPRGGFRQPGQRAAGRACLATAS